MLLRITRKLTIEEVEEKIKQFEKDFGMDFGEFEELFQKQKLEATAARAYPEWAELVDSYRGYVEDGELDYVSEEIEDLSSEQTALLTPKRFELLCQLASIRVESINALAKKVRRNIKNVYQDLKVLERLGFVKLSKRKGRELIPETPIKEIAFLIR